MVKVEVCMDILLLKRQGLSERAIARKLDVTGWFSQQPGFLPAQDHYA
ncbi:MAG: hypothetical protein JW781_08855 [Deltaproteobacteria bacterium]|nr:hypothetical protein [Candidatus Anaeroferrophillacea bacterium]